MKFFQKNFTFFPRTVHTLNGNEMTTTEHTFILTMRPHDTIHKLKRLLSEKEGLGIDKQHISFKGRLLDDDSQTLADCGISSKSTLVLEMEPNEDQPVGFGAAAIISPASPPWASPVATPSTGAGFGSPAGVGVKLRVHRIGIYVHIAPPIVTLPSNCSAGFVI